jgi:hypothetical protein
MTLYRMICPSFEATPNNVRIWDALSPIVTEDRSLVMIRVLPPFPSLAGGYSISGITKTGAGVPIGGCTVDLYLTDGKILVGSTTSNPATGAYSFPGLINHLAFYVVARKEGAPDLAGTTINDLVAA